jgi:hypothetical protein
MCFGIYSNICCNFSPIYSVNMFREVYYRASYGFATGQSILNTSHGYFFQGIGMIVFSIITGYKPIYYI